MGSATTEISIDRPADDIWKIVADFGGLADWMPGVDSCVLDGDDRNLSMMGMKIVEHLVRRDDDTRTLTYSIVGGDLSVDHHEATIAVTPQGDGSHVTWAVTVEPDSLVDVMQGAYDGALRSLKEKAEG